MKHLCKSKWNWLQFDSYIFQENTKNTTIVYINTQVQLFWSVGIKSVSDLDRYNIGGSCFNSAFVDTALHKGVAFSSPFGTPRVTNNPVVDTIKCSIADDHNSVIDTYTIALWISIHTAPTSDRQYYYSRDSLVRIVITNKWRKSRWRQLQLQGDHIPEGLFA